MSDSKKYKLALTGFIVMVILNIGILVSLWVMKPPHFHRHIDKPDFRVQSFIEHELNLSPEQKKAFDQLRSEHMKRSGDIIGEMQHNREQLVDLLKVKDPAVRNAKLDSLTTLIGREQVRLEQAIFNHFVNLRALCSEDQKKKFDQVMQEILHRFNARFKDEKTDSLSKGKAR